MVEDKEICKRDLACKEWEDQITEEECNKEFQEDKECLCLR